MTLFVKQSTAVDVVVGAFVDDTDFKTVETGLTISQADVQLSKNAGAFAQKNEATTATHLGGGHYKIPLNSTDTNTLGVIRGYVNETGALPVWFDLMVMPANVWDSLFGADLLQVDAAQWLGGTIATPTVTGVPEVDITHYGGTAGTFASGRPEVNTTHWRGTAAAVPATAGIPKVAIEAAGDFAQGAADKVWSTTTRTLTALGASLVQEIWDRATSALTTVGSIGKLIVDNLNATISSRATQTSVDTIDDFVDTEIADIQSRLPAALVSGRMDSHVGSVADAVLTAAKFAAGAFDAVWAVATRLLTAGTNIVLAKGVGVTGFNDVSTAQVNAEVVDALATDTYAEPGQGAPAATASLAAKINYLFKSWRNKKDNNGTETKLYADDGTTVDQKQSTSESAGTVTKAEWVTGP